jgi:thymidylate synthase
MLPYATQDPGGNTMGKFMREHREKRGVLQRRVENLRRSIKEYSHLISEGEITVKDLVENKLPEWRKKLEESKRILDYSLCRLQGEFGDEEKSKKKEKIAQIKDTLERLEIELRSQLRDEEHRARIKEKNKKR